MQGPQIKTKPFIEHKLLQLLPNEIKTASSFILKNGHGGSLAVFQNKIIQRGRNVSLGFVASLFQIWVFYIVNTLKLPFDCKFTVATLFLVHNITLDTIAVPSELTMKQQ